MLDKVLMVLLLVLVAVLIAVAIIMAYKQFAELPLEGQRDKIREWLLYAVTYAEKTLGGGTGALKLRMVYDMFLNKFPKLASRIKFEDFSKMVDEALVKMKSMLQSNAAAREYVNGDE